MEDTMAAWNEVLDELEKLVLHKTTSTEPLPVTPAMDRCKFIDSEKTRVVSGLGAAKMA